MEPEDEINLVEMGNNIRKGGKLIKRKSYIMSAGKIQDVVRYENERKQKTGNGTECNIPTSFKTQRIRGTYIKIFYNLTFKREDNYGL